MDVINNRYKIIREIYHNEKNILSYVALDFHNDNNRIGISIIKPDELSPISKDFIKSNFLQISSMSNDRFFANYEFSSTIIEDENDLKRVFYFTHELHEEYSSLLDYLDPLNIEKILLVIVKICQAQNLAIMNGFLHSINNLEDFYIYDGENDFDLRATDLITMSLSAETLTMEYQFENIATLFLSLLDGYVETKTISENIQGIRETYQYHFLNEYQNKLFEVILDVCKNIQDGKYGSIIYDFYYLLIADINAQLNTFFSADTDTITNYFCWRPRIINREKDIEHIVKEITSIGTSTVKHIYAVTGNMGVGKSQFLSSLVFSLHFENVDCYHFELLHAPYIFLLRLFSDIFVRYSVLSIGIDINKLYLQVKDCCLGSSLHQDDKYDLIKKLTQILLNAAKIRPQVIVIDNFNSVDKFTFEFIFSLIMRQTGNTRITFVLAFSKTFGNSPSYFATYYKALSTLDCYNEVSLTGLTPFETATLMKNILLMRIEPVITANEINKVAAGNPRFVIELLSNLITEKQLWRNKTDGFWEMMSDVYTISHFFEVPETIVKYVKTIFAKYFSDEYSLFKYMSIFQVAFKKNFIAQLLPDISEEEIDTYIHDSLYNGFITEIKPDVYAITEKILQATLYSILTLDEKKTYHTKAIQILQDETDELFIDEIFIHHAWLGNNEEVLNIAVDTAHRKLKNGNLRDAVINYERALLILDDEYDEKKLLIISELATVYCNLGVLTSATAYFKESLPHIDKFTDKKKLFNYYLNYCSLLYEITDIQQFTQETSVLMHLFETLDSLTVSEMVQAQRIFVLNMIVNRDFKSATVELHKLIKIAKEDSLAQYELPTLYRLLGNAYIYTHNYKPAQHALQESYRFAQEYKDTLNQLRALNNTAMWHIQYEADFTEAEKTYKEILALSTQVGFDRITLLCYLNMVRLAIGSGDFNLSEYYISRVMEKLLIVNSGSTKISFYANILNYELLLKKNYFAKAIIMKKNFQNMIDKNDNTLLVGENIITFHILTSYLELIFGNYDECLNNLRIGKTKAIDYTEKEIIQFKIELIEFLIGHTSEEVNIINSFLLLIQNLHTTVVTQLISHVIFIIILSIPLQRFELLKNFVLIVLEKIDSRFDNLSFVQAELKIIQAMVNKNEAEELLNAALVSIRTQGILPLQIIIQEQLALYYFEERKYGFGILSFIGAQNDIIKLMKFVPTEKQLVFFNLYAFKVPFQVVYNFIKRGETHIDKALFLEKVSDVGLMKLLQAKDINSLIRNNDFLEILLCDVFDINDWVLKYRTLKETIKNFRSNYEYNVKITLNLLMQRLLAIYSNIIITNAHNEKCFMFAQDSKVISFMDFSTALENGNIEGVKEYAEKRNLEVLLFPLSDDGNSNTDEKYTLLFVIQNQVAIVSKRRVGYCKDLTSFILSLLHSYRLNDTVHNDLISNAVTPRYFEDFIASTVDYDSKTSTQLTVCYFSIENLKMIDTFYGHEVCNEIIKNVLEIVYSTIQSIDLVARYAKDEFAILFYGASKQIVMQKIERIKKKISDFEFHGMMLPIALSFGMARLHDEGVNVSDIVDKARRAFLLSKEQGINKVVHYSSGNETQHAYQNQLALSNVKLFDYNTEQISYLLEFITILSSYASKKAMIHIFLEKLLDITNAETISLVQFANPNDSNTKYTITEDIITVRAKHIMEDTAVNMYYVQQAAENIQTMIFDELKLHEVEDVVYPTWQAILVCPIYSGVLVKGGLYFTVNHEYVHAINKNSSFITLLARLLEKEL